MAQSLNHLIASLGVWEEGWRAKCKNNGEIYTIRGRGTAEGYLSCENEFGYLHDINYEELDFYDYSVECFHDWEEKPLFSSTYRRCKKCGKEAG